MSATLVTKLSDVYATLSKRDGRFEALENSNHYPAYNVAQNVGEEARQLDEAAAAFQAEFPGRMDIVERLNSGVRELSRIQGKLSAMASSGSTYGAGWGSTLDGEIVAVRDALLISLQKG